MRRNPPPPFITSTLQQEASRKLGLGAATAMRIAQRLYEGVDIGGETVGLITYMRTDGVQLAPEAIGQTRRLIETKYGASYVPASPRVYTSKAKNAQEAHEAIRPTDLFRTPRDVAQYLDKDQLGLYELIWKRTVASQMESAVLDQVTVDIASGDKTVQLRATGSVVKFNGFLTLYDEGQRRQAPRKKRAAPSSPTSPRTRRWIAARSCRNSISPSRRRAIPEASLVKKLEELGIGRPSTYASIIEVLQRRNYVTHRPQALQTRRSRPHRHGVPADLFPALRRIQLHRRSRRRARRHLGRPDRTGARCCANSGRPSRPRSARPRSLRVKEVLDKLDEELGPHFFPANDNGGKNPRDCPSCANGRLGPKLGKFGAFIGCSNYPECRFTRSSGIVDADADAARRCGEPRRTEDPRRGIR